MRTRFDFRLLGEKLGLTVYKIPDELWERSYLQFQVELKPGVKLEARPHGYTEDDKPVYTRTGKVAKVLRSVDFLAFLSKLVS